MRCVSGIAKGAGYAVGDELTAEAKSDHEWNIIRLEDGEEYHLDSTWSAGVCNGPKFYHAWNEHYFLTSAAEFIYDHYPEDSRDQLLVPPVSLREFSSYPQFQPTFFRAEMKPRSRHPMAGILHCKGGSEIEIPFEISRLWTLFEPKPAGSNKQEQKFERLAIVLWETPTHARVIVRVPKGPGEYKLSLFARLVEAKGEPASCAVRYLLRVTDPSGSVPAPFPKLFSTDRLDVLEPLVATLQIGTEVRFLHRLAADEDADHRKQPRHKVTVILPGNVWVPLVPRTDLSGGGLLYDKTILMRDRGEVQIAVSQKDETSASTVAVYRVV